MNDAARLCANMPLLINRDAINYDILSFLSSVNGDCSSALDLPSDFEIESCYTGKYIYLYYFPNLSLFFNDNFIQNFYIM